jgi:predicted DNA-binding transcriptional regulator AlpA
MTDRYNEMLEEIQSETNLVKREQLLQKYGLTEPKLTEEERASIFMETIHTNPESVGWRKADIR